MGLKSMEKHASTRISVNKEMISKLEATLKKVKGAVTTEHWNDISVARSNISDLMKIQEDYIERLEKELFVLKEEKKVEIDDGK